MYKKLILGCLFLGLLSGCASSDKQPFVDKKTSCTGLDTAYVVVLDNLAPSKMLDVERGLMSLSCYIHHRPTVTSGRYTEFWYQTTLGTAAMNRRLHRLLDSLGIEAVVQYSGNEFRVQQVTGRR